MTAQEALSLALTALTDHGWRTPCQGRHRDRWTSDLAEERAWAASVCVTLRCPVLEQCGAAADEAREQWGVWAGVDRGPARTRKGHSPQPPVRPEERRPECVNVTAAFTPGGSRSDGEERGQIPRRPSSAPAHPAAPVVTPRRADRV